MYFSQMVERQSTNIAMLNKEYRSAKIELEQLRRNVSENAARNPIICDEMQVGNNEELYTEMSQ